MKRRTAKERRRRTLTARWPWWRSHRHCPVPEQHQAVCLKRRGHYQDYGIRGNYRRPEVVVRHAECAWRYWVNRRSPKGTITGQKITWWQAPFPLPPPRRVDNL
jgi:hypothetical protein